MATIDQIQIPSGTYDIMVKSFYGTCSTAAATAAKVVTLSNAVGWSLVPGVIVGIKFTYTNTVTNVTLNVNGSGAKSIYFANAVYTGIEPRITGFANCIIYYMYDGTNWVFLNYSGNYSNTDTKNTAGSTDTSSKIFLIGATSQAANPQTYSDNEVYATNGVLTTKSVQVGGTAATIQYNSTTKSIDFVFA